MFRRIADHVHHLRCELLAHRRLLDDLDHVFVDLSDNRPRRAARRDQSVPGIGVDVDAGLHQGRHVGQKRRALGGGDGENLHAARGAVRRHRDRRQTSHLRVVADHRGNGLRRTWIGQVHQARAGLQRDRLHGEMRQRAVADRAEIILAGILLEQRDQLGDGVDLELRIDREDARLRHQLRDRRDVFRRVVGQFRKQQRVDGERAADADADSGAVGRGFRDQIGGEIAAGAGLVLDQENTVGIFLGQPITDKPRHDVRRRTRPEWHQNVHGLGRPSRRCRLRRCRHAGREQQQQRHHNAFERRPLRGCDH